LHHPWFFSSSFGGMDRDDHELSLAPITFGGPSTVQKKENELQPPTSFMKLSEINLT